jgi:hypothetical protein
MPNRGRNAATEARQGDVAMIRMLTVFALIAALAAAPVYADGGGQDPPLQKQSETSTGGGLLGDLLEIALEALGF